MSVRITMSKGNVAMAEPVVKDMGGAGTYQQTCPTFYLLSLFILQRAHNLLHSLSGAVTDASPCHLNIFHSYLFSDFFRWSPQNYFIFYWKFPTKNSTCHKCVTLSSNMLLFLISNKSLMITKTW